MPDPQFHSSGIYVTAVQCLVVADEGRFSASRASFSFLRDPPLVDNGPMVPPRAFYDSHLPKASLIRESGSITTTPHRGHKLRLPNREHRAAPRATCAYHACRGESMGSLGIAIWPGMACPGATGPGPSVKGFAVEVVQGGR